MTDKNLTADELFVRDLINTMCWEEDINIGLMPISRLCKQKYADGTGDMIYSNLFSPADVTSIIADLVRYNYIKISVFNKNLRHKIININK